MSYNALFRPLKDGKEFDNLFPKPSGNRINLGKGDTHTSIELIIKWVLENNHEVKKVATKLQKSSLELTCLSIHDFLYNHFQYEADGEAQLLRSPAYAWKHRFKGIDCKSYSIIASSILLQLGIKHYIRKIKQPAFQSDSFTHVYVVVPVDQTTGSLNNEYFTIDGTLKNTIEPIFTVKKDFFMDKLQHYGLKGVEDIDFETLSKLDFNSISGFFSSLKCLGGSSYTGARFDDNIKKIIAFHTAIINQYNEAITSGNYARVGQIVGEYFAKNNALDEAFRQNRNKNWNDCTDSNLVATRKFITQKMRDIVGVALFAHFKKYFNSQTVGTYVYRHPKITNDVFDGVNYAHVSSTSEIVSDAFETFTATPSAFQIPAFEVNQYLTDAIKSSSNASYDSANYLQLLQQAGTIIATVTNPVDTNGNPVDANGQSVYDEQNKPKTDNAGMGLLFGGLAFAGLVAWGFSKMKDKGTKNLKK